MNVLLQATEIWSFLFEELRMALQISLNVLQASFGISHSAEFKICSIESFLRLTIYKIDTGEVSYANAEL